MDKKITVAMSGGVDSSVAALLAKEHGARVSGVYMRTWHSDDTLHPLGNCPWHRDAEDARCVAEAIGIDFKIVNMIDFYEKFVVAPLVDGYRNGTTPNPDVLCNQFVKFGILAEMAREEGADEMATGHYCKKRKNLNGTEDIIEPADKNKDQSYFLAYLKQKQIQFAAFPISDFSKREVRKIAMEHHFSTANKKDSQGICFLGNVKIQDFLTNYIPYKPGNIVDIHGNVLGQHQGLHNFTIGQRHGLNISSNSDYNFYVVIAKNLLKNELQVAFESERKLYNKVYKVRHLSYTNEALADRCEIACRPRYRDPYQRILFEKISGDEAVIEFKTSQRALAPGQIVAFYDSGILLGGGTYF